MCLLAGSQHSGSWVWDFHASGLLGFRVFKTGPGKRLSTCFQGGAQGFQNSASGNTWASPHYHFHVCIYKYIYTHIVSNQFYNIISRNTLKYPFKTMHWRHQNKISSIRNVTFLQYFSLAFLPLSLCDLPLSQNTTLTNKNRCPWQSKIIGSKHNSHIPVLRTRALVQEMHPGKAKWKPAMNRFLDSCENYLSIWGKSSK